MSLPQILEDEYGVDKRKEEILSVCVSYDQYRELEDKVEILTVRFNELLEYLANTSGNEHLRAMKVDEE